MICQLKEQGVKNPEDHVLTQYYLSNDANSLPMPIDADASLEAGILMLNPDEAEEARQGAPHVGGLFGTVRSLFRVLGFDIPKEEETVSKTVAVRKRRSGSDLYGE